MYIKRLELQGFKTFPERTKIVFNPGITIIIGPNGTGKSNIVEAIQWVLGGQRVRTVRGEKTEDAIFNGTQKRPAVGMADVTLVLHNAEEELQINHRAFRTGESEYRLNGKAVRLKDIQDELWKKAVSENKYYVIEQGAIGTFVTSKPTEKRALVEEAAGTAYYKDKKRLAEHKLDDSEQNLTRLEDIIAEVAKARNSLARQAGAAERYRKLRERIRELTLLHFKQKGNEVQAGQAEVQTRHEESLARERETGARLAEEERRVNLKRKEAWELEQSLKSGQERLYAFKAQIAKAEAERERESRRVDDLDSRRLRAAAESDELLAELLALENEIQTAREDLAAQEEALGSTETAVAELERGHEETQARLEPLTRKAASLRSDAIQKLAEVTSSRNEQAKVEKEVELILRQEDRLRSRRSETQTLLESKAAALEAIERERADTDGQAGRLETAREEARLKVDEAAAGINDLRQRIGDLEDVRSETFHHLQALRRLEAKERESAAVPALSSAVGAFSDLLQADPGDAPLIDVFWKEEAKALLIGPQEFLDALGAGNLAGNFLLIPSVPVPGSEDPLPADECVIGRLKARLRPGRALDGRIPALDDALIVKDIRSAVWLWLRHPGRNFITPEGDLLLRGGLVRLGQRREGLFTFVQEIRDLEAKLAGQDRQIEPLALELETALANKGRSEAAMEDLALNLAEIRRSIVDLEKRAVLAAAERDKLQDDLSLIGHDLEVLAMDRQGFLDKLAFQTQALEKLSEEERGLRERAEHEDREMGLHQERLNREARTLVERRGVIGLLGEKKAGLLARIQTHETRKSAAAAKLTALQEEARSSEEEQESLRQLIVEWGDRTVNLDGQRAAEEEALNEGDLNQGRIRKELEEAEAVLAGLREEYERRKDARMETEVRKAEVERDLVNLEETCWQELKRTLAEVRAETLPEEEAGSDITAELEEAKDKLLRIGAVNLMAEEEYQQQKERHDFLARERTDLRESIAQTKEAIRQIDEESRQRFLTALAEVNRYFQELFEALFKGGAAEVRLLDPNDPLESGIEVIAQPPGKKIGNMGLLSGGEKSLTSLAFLFALFRFKPTPFCILDEVDAALDEANLVRFLDLMKAIKSDTQFIIITHNYRTMEVADYIYGTTMEEPNVTKIFSMKLEKKGDSQAVG